MDNVQKHNICINGQFVQRLRFILMYLHLIIWELAVLPS
jgi:hypothetical protein